MERKTETYTDEQVTAACGLHIDNLRRLITWGAVTPVQSGGGRGRVRKWTARQALRISVTAQFVEAGFSLQMGHTLTYCLPLDDLLYMYDPNVISTYLRRKRGREYKRLRAMISPAGGEYWPGRNSFGSHVFIVDRRYMYADVLGDSSTLLAVIDPSQQRVVPWLNPYRFYWGGGMADDFKLPKVVDAKQIARSSLLIADDLLHDNQETSLDQIKNQLDPFQKHIPEGVDTQINRLERLVFKNLCMINLAVGLTSFVRSLLGLPVKYHPFEVEYDEEYDEDSRA